LLHNECLLLLLLLLLLLFRYGISPENFGYTLALPYLLVTFPNE